MDTYINSPRGCFRTVLRSSHLASHPLIKDVVSYYFYLAPPFSFSARPTCSKYNNIQKNKIFVTESKRSVLVPIALWLLFEGDAGARNRKPDGAPCANTSFSISQAHLSCQQCVDRTAPRPYSPTMPEARKKRYTANVANNVENEHTVSQ